jgi:hypothetical protein
MTTKSPDCRVYEKGMPGTEGERVRYQRQMTVQCQEQEGGASIQYPHRILLVIANANANALLKRKRQYNHGLIQRINTQKQLRLGIEIRKTTRGIVRSTASVVQTMRK